MQMQETQSFSSDYAKIVFFRKLSYKNKLSESYDPDSER